MIRRELKSQLIELEKRYAAAVAAKRDEETAPGRWALLHAVEVAAMVLYGEPTIAEPLRFAHLRMEEKLAKQFGAAADEYWQFERKVHPTCRGYSVFMFEALPGANNKLKFERIFSEAPAWLLNFTGIDWHA